MSKRMDDPFAVYVCEKCGGENVDHAMWVDLNTDEPNELFGSWCAGDNNWCNDCEAHTFIVMDGEFKKQQERAT